MPGATGALTSAPRYTDIVANLETWEDTYVRALAIIAAGPDPGPGGAPGKDPAVFRNRYRTYVSERLSWIRATAPLARAKGH